MHARAEPVLRAGGGLSPAPCKACEKWGPVQSERTVPKPGGADGLRKANPWDLGTTGSGDVCAADVVIGTPPHCGELRKRSRLEGEVMRLVGAAWEKLQESARHVGRGSGQHCETGR